MGNSKHLSVPDTSGKGVSQAGIRSNYSVEYVGSIFYIFFKLFVVFEPEQSKIVSFGFRHKVGWVEGVIWFLSRAQGDCLLCPGHGEYCGTELRALLLLERILDTSINYDSGHFFSVALHKGPEGLCCIYGHF